MAKKRGFWFCIGPYLRTFSSHFHSLSIEGNPDLARKYSRGHKDIAVTFIVESSSNRTIELSECELDVALRLSLQLEWQTHSAWQADVLDTVSENPSFDYNGGSFEPNKFRMSQSFIFRRVSLVGSESPQKRSSFPVTNLVGNG